MSLIHALESIALAITSTRPNDHDYIEYTPTFTNVSGHSLTFARYSRVGNIVHVHGSISLNGANVSGSIIMSLPYLAQYIRYAAAGNAQFYDSSALTTYTAVVRIYDDDRVQFRAVNTAGTYGVDTQTTSLIPFTWAVNDEINFSFVYEADDEG